ncbi:hypothetical protein [Desulfurobacterium crinifex]
METHKKIRKVLHMKEHGHSLSASFPFFYLLPNNTNSLSSSPLPRGEEFFVMQVEHQVTAVKFFKNPIIKGGGL